MKTELALDPALDAAAFTNRKSTPFNARISRHSRWSALEASVCVFGMHFGIPFNFWVRENISFF